MVIKVERLRFTPVGMRRVSCGACNGFGFIRYSHDVSTTAMTLCNLCGGRGEVWVSAP